MPCGVSERLLVSRSIADGHGAHRRGEECFFVGSVCVFADCYAAQVRASTHYLWVSLLLGCILPSWLYMESGLEGGWLVVFGMPLAALCGASVVRNPQQRNAAEPLSGELQREAAKATESLQRRAGPVEEGVARAPPLGVSANGNGHCALANLASRHLGSRRPGTTTVVRCVWLWRSASPVACGSLRRCAAVDEFAAPRRGRRQCTGRVLSW